MFWSPEVTGLESGVARLAPSGSSEEIVRFLAFSGFWSLPCPLAHDPFLSSHNLLLPCYIDFDS